MITFSNMGRLIQHESELPDLKHATLLYADFETTSGSPKESSVDPFHNCDIAGIAITVDNEPQAWYIPVGHHHGHNLNKEVVYDWWCDIVDTCEVWVNHNVKYDAHVSTNWAGVYPECKFYDTLNVAKILDSDRGMKGGYGLDALSYAWLHEDIGHYEQAFQSYLYRNKDYGAVPPDIMGEYACQDVLTARRVHKYLEAKMPDECRQVVETENELTYVLFQVEINGLRVNPEQLKIKEYLIMKRLLEIDEELTLRVGRSFRPNVAADCFDVLCNQYGLPVLAWNEEEDEDGNVQQKSPSFDKHALVKYLAHPLAPPGVVELIQEYRKLATLNSLFVVRYQEQHLDCLLHPSYNQTVRTGRMSCKKPNAQQLSSAAKMLIIPPPGESFISIDYSQIEFRLIVHYIQDVYALDAYEKDPWTDFHNWVSELCKIKRKPAKTMNFLMGYGGGKGLVTSALSVNMDLVGELKDKIALQIELGELDEENALKEFDRLAKARAEAVYENYHASLPSLKRTARKAAKNCERRGYVFNLYGRRRHLPKDKSHLAFNTLCQAGAADLMKERTVAVAKVIKDTPIKIVASVHDETLFTAPTEVANDPRTVRDLAYVLENPACKLRVPIKCSAGVSDKNWYEASHSSSSVYYNLNEVENLRWLTNGSE